MLTEQASLEVEVYRNWLNEPLVPLPNYEQSFPVDHLLHLFVGDAALECLFVSQQCAEVVVELLRKGFLSG